MHLRTVLLVLIIALLGLIALLSLEWKHGLGSFATSPQHLEVPARGRAIIGGGRAIFELKQLKGDEAWIGIACNDDELQVEAMRPGQTTDEVCGLWVTLEAFLPGFGPERPPRARIAVAWEGEGAALPTPDS